MCVLCVLSVVVYCVCVSVCCLLLCVVSVCLCAVCCALCCISTKTPEKGTTLIINNWLKTRLKIAWTIQKTQDTLGKLSKHGLRFWHDMVNCKPRKRPKTATFPDTLFLHFSHGFVDDFGRRSFPKRPNAPKRHFFYPRSCSKGPDHVLAKVQTSETPDVLN